MRFILTEGIVIMDSFSKQIHINHQPGKVYLKELVLDIHLNQPHAKIVSELKRNLRTQYPVEVNSMLKLKTIVNVLLFLTISICLHSIDTSIAGTCDEIESSGSTSTATGDHDYSENWNTAPELDPSIPEEIAPDSSIPLTVSGGCAPYTWSVSGTGFTLETEGEPTGPINTLYADGSACGAATITVIGCDGTQIAGYVRSTTGQWEDYADRREVCIAASLYSKTGITCDIVVGKTKYVSRIAIYETTEECVACPPYDCTAGPSYCGSENTVDGWKRRSWGENYELEWKCP